MLAGPILGEARAEQSIEAVRGIAACPDVSELLALINPAQR